MSETQTTELMQDSALFDDVAKQALGRYEFDGDEAKLLTFSENYTYLVRNPVTGSKDAVLRISRPGYHTLEELEGEMAWLRQINDYTPLVVANPLPAQDDSYIQSVTGPDGAGYQCVVCEFLSGEAPSEGDPKGMVSQFCQLGETTAYLHRQTEIWNGTRRLKRISWTHDTIIGEHAAWGPWQAFEGLAPQDTAQLERCCTTIQRRLERYGMSERTFGLIHADLRLANLLVENDQVKVIDFDDCGFGWHLHDLAGALSFIETSPLGLRPCELLARRVPQGAALHRHGLRGNRHLHHAEAPAAHRLARKPQGLRPREGAVAGLGRRHDGTRREISAPVRLNTKATRDVYPQD